MKNPPGISKSPASGFTLTEVIVALGLFVFAITAIMGVIPFGMNQVQTASNESHAMADMESIRDDISLALANKMPKSLRYSLANPSAAATTGIDLLFTENGEPLSGSGIALYRITGSLKRPAASSPDPVHLHLRATWPAKAPPGRESGYVELVTAFEP